MVRLVCFSVSWIILSVQSCLMFFIVSQMPQFFVTINWNISVNDIASSNALSLRVWCSLYVVDSGSDDDFYCFRTRFFSKVLLAYRNTSHDFRIALQNFWTYFFGLAGSHYLPLLFSVSPGFFPSQSGLILPVIPQPVSQPSAFSANGGWAPLPPRGCY